MDSPELNETVKAEDTDKTWAAPETPQGKLPPCRDWLFENNGEYLQRWFDFLESLKEPWPDSFPKSDIPPERLSPAGQFAALNSRSERSFSAGADIPLERICSDKKLDSREKFLLLALAYSQISENEIFHRRTNLFAMMGKIGLGKPLELLGYFEQGSRLVSLKMASVSFMFRADSSTTSLRLHTPVLHEILGRKQPDSPSPKENKRPAHFSAPQPLEKALSRYVVGQEEAKRRLAAAVYMHSRRADINEQRSGPDLAPKCNILIIGPTGTGKTHICRALADILQVAFAHCDATQYTETGYVGGNVEDMVAQLQKNARENSSFERGIIFIDEVDKLASRNRGSLSGTKVLDGWKVQQELLKLLDGENVSYSSWRGGSCCDYKWNVKSILFVAAGAFGGLEEIVARRLKSRKIGFERNETAEVSRNSLLKKAIPSDLIEYGFCAEFIGRFPVIIVFDELTKRDLVNILTKRNGAISTYEEIFRMTGHDFAVSESFLDEVADEALKRGTGARALNAILEERMSAMLYEACASDAPAEQTE